MADTVISVEALGKRYERHVVAPKTLRESTGRRVSRLLARSDGGAGGADSEVTGFWALRDVSFSVAAGEVLGVIGPNGAGKSTLLKILARITAPTEGTAEIRGDVTALLQLGAGFHPELTGRENVVLAGTAHGFGPKAVRREMDEIVAFAGVEAALDEPLKHYSDGMRMRLAFSVAAQFASEVLLVDEVFSVGDAEFQERATARLSGMIRNGLATVMVGHDLDRIAALCDKAIYFSAGQVAEIGAPKQVIGRYLSNRDGASS